jgi:hypothetical protein
MAMTPITIPTISDFPSVLVLAVVGVACEFADEVRLVGKGLDDTVAPVVFDGRVSGVVVNPAASVPLDIVKRFEITRT